MGRADTCVFCDIVAGRGEASLVWLDDHVLAFLSLQQHRPGHTLIIPRRHFATIYDLDESLAGPLFAVTGRIARAVKHAFQPDGILIRQNNERAAGQIVFHVHLHVIPREEGALYAAEERPKPSARADLDAYSERIRQALRALSLTESHPLTSGPPSSD